MTKEEKELLLQDICARLPYGVILHDEYCKKDYKLNSIDANGFINYDIANSITHIKPYLRPMSSMTEEESKEFALFQTDFYVDGFLYPIAAINMINWVNAHHFDYTNLIPKGVALEAPEGMYNTKTE